MEKFTKKISTALSNIIYEKSILVAEHLGGSIIYPRDLMLCIIFEGGGITNDLLQKSGVDKDKICSVLQKIQVEVKSVTQAEKTNKIGKATNWILVKSNKLVEDLEDEEIEIMHVIWCFLSYTGKNEFIVPVKNALFSEGLTEKKFKIYFSRQRKKEDILKKYLRSEEEVSHINSEEKESENPTPNKNKGDPLKGDKNKYTAMKRNLIKDGYILPLNTMEINKEKIIGREKEVQRVFQVLARKKKNNLIVIGESGVGKSSVVNAVVKKIFNKECPKRFIKTEIISINMGNIIAGAKYRGQFEERMKVIFHFAKIAKRANKEIVFFIDDIHIMVGTGSGDGGLNAASLLKPHIDSGILRCIGATSIEDYRRHIVNKDNGFSRRFFPILIEESNQKDSLSILSGIKTDYEEFHDITISEEIMSDVISLCNRYMTNRSFPDKAIDVLDEACSRSSLNNEKELKKETLEEIISEMTGILITSISQKERETLNKLKEIIKESVVGQDQPINIISDFIRKSRIGLKDINKPIGVFLLLGPTGCGKTLLAKTLSETLFGLDKIIRLDMSEYMDKTSVNKITGSAPGYVGYDDGSKLVEAVRTRPYSVILIDEIEKAHRDVLNIFLQIFDEGRLTDTLGRRVDFRNTIIIMTSNLATSKIDGQKKTVGFQQDNNTKDVEKFLNREVEKYFSPEFVNRIDEVMVFSSLTKENFIDIFDIEFKKVEKRLELMNIKVEISKKAKDHMAAEGYSKKYGARPMVRKIQKLIETPMASEILSGNIQSGNVVYIDMDDASKTLIFNPKK